LLEYKRFKEAANQFDSRERLWRDVFFREQGPPMRVRSEEALLENITLFDLVDALQEVIARTPGRRLIEIVPENLTVRDRMNAILDALEGKDSVTFASLFEDSCHRLVVIVTFLGLLELIRIRVVRVFQAETFGPILVSRAFSLVTETEPPEMLEESEWRNL
jgi:segregation and condensation protein A